MKKQYFEFVRQDMKIYNKLINILDFPVCTTISLICGYTNEIDMRNPGHEVFWCKRFTSTTTNWPVD